MLFASRIKRLGAQCSGSKSVNVYGLENTVLHTHNPRPHHHHVINFLQKEDLEMYVHNNPVTENPYDEVPLYEELV
jgi:hypothetical protein